MSEQTAEPLSDEPSASPADYAPLRFTTKKWVLTWLAERAVSIIPARDFQPVLRNFQLRVSHDGLFMAVTDLELAVLASSPTVQTDREDTLVLPGRRLLQILRELADDDVEVIIEHDFAVLRCGGFVTRLKLDDGTDYPDLPAMPDLEDLHPYPREALLAGLKAVKHAVCRNGGLPSLLMVNIAGGKITACDNSRLAQARLDGFPIDMQIPAGGSPSAVDELIRMLSQSEAEEIRVGATGSHLVFVIGGITFLALRPVARFPDVERVLLEPAMKNDLALTVARSDLSDAVRRVRINADPSTAAIALRLGKDGATVIAKDKWRNEATEHIEAKWTGSERTVVVNHGYLSEMLASHPADQCEFRLAKTTGRGKSTVLLHDPKSGVIGIIQQMVGAQLGY